MVLYNKYKGGIKYKDLGKYNEGGDIGRGVRLGGVRVEISYLGRQQVLKEGKGILRSV